MEEQMARRLVAAEGKKLQQAGLVARTWGNISCRIDENHFVITPSGLDYETMTAVDLVLMDITLPYFSGYYWCAEIRKISRVPVLFLSSASDDMNLIMAINMGADDFIAKPFKFEVVLAKIQAIIRRTYDFGRDLNTLNCRGVTLNLGDGVVSFGEEKLELSRNEYKILEILMKKKGNVVPREDLIQALWDTEEFIDENTLTVNVARLRQRLKQIGVEELISTRKGVGYLIMEP